MSDTAEVWCPVSGRGTARLAPMAKRRAKLNRKDSADRANGRYDTIVLALESQTNRSIVLTDSGADENVNQGAEVEVRRDD